MTTPSTAPQPAAREPLASVWRSAWRDRRFRLAALATPVVLFAVLQAYGRVLVFVEGRPGVVLPDPILDLLAPRDATGPVFALVYGSLLLALVALLRQPRAMVVGVQAYAIMVVVRMIALYLLPLDPPPGMIILRDPFAQSATVATPLTRDLFFSGHTASVFLCYLGVPGKWLPRIFLVAAVLIGVLVLMQHVHYAVDVAAAPLASWAAYRAARAIDAAGRSDV